MSAQPVKDAQAIKAFAEMGLVNLRQMAASQGESAEKNAKENAALMANMEMAKATDGDSDTNDKLDILVDNMK